MTISVIRSPIPNGESGKAEALTKRGIQLLKVSDVKTKRKEKGGKMTKLVIPKHQWNKVLCPGGLKITGVFIMGNVKPVLRCLMPFLS